MDSRTLIRTYLKREEGEKKRNNLNAEVKKTKDTKRN